MAGELEVSGDTVAKRCSRFLRDRLEGLTDEPRPGRPRVTEPQFIDKVRDVAGLYMVPVGGRPGAMR